jgi:hypothetical protein
MNAKAGQELDRLDELKTKLATTEAERDDLRARFEDVIHSRSWRLTEPLRALKRRFRR